MLINDLRLSVALSPRNFKRLHGIYSVFPEGANNVKYHVDIIQIFQLELGLRDSSVCLVILPPTHPPSSSAPIFTHILMC